MDPKPAPPDLVVARLARRQHGVAAIWQLRECGLGPTAIRNRVRAGRLHRLHRGVYAVGHRPAGARAAWMAAVLACSSGTAPLGHKAALSHRSAAALLGLLETVPGPVDVSTRGRAGRSGRRGIRIHRPRELTVAELTLREGIPATTIGRTITDLERIGSPSLVRRAIRQAAVLGVDVGVDLEDTRSELERRFLRLCRAHRLPPPRVNVPVGGFIVDFLWDTAGLIVETDGYRFHRGRAAFERDRGRDLALRGLGYEVVRLSYRQIVDDSRAVAAVLSAALGAGSGS